MCNPKKLYKRRKVRTRDFIKKLENKRDKLADRKKEKASKTEKQNELLENNE